MRLTWESAEQDLRDALNLESTPGSGNKFYAPGDGVDNSHSSDKAYRFIADTKSTVNKSYGVKEQFLLEWQEKAMEMGKVFLLHLQFQDESKNHKSDWVLTSLDDFVEISTIQQEARDHQKSVRGQAYSRIQEVLDKALPEEHKERFFKDLRVLAGEEEG